MYAFGLAHHITLRKQRTGNLGEKTGEFSPTGMLEEFHVKNGKGIMQYVLIGF